MNTDPIVREVREARAEIATEFDHDLSKYLAWVREQTQLRKQVISKPLEEAKDNLSAKPSVKSRHSRKNTIRMAALVR
jgi:hypothetical protein